MRIPFTQLSLDALRSRINRPDAAGSAASGLYASFVFRNLVNQHRASANPLSVARGSRLDAFVSTARHGPGTVGFGAHPNIAAIHALLGGVGQSDVGELFRRSGSELSSPIESGGNRQLAENEHGYWRHRLSPSPGTSRFAPWDQASRVSTLSDRVGGLMGSAVSPGPRAWLQSTMASVRNVHPGIAMRGPGVAASLVPSALSAFLANRSRRAADAERDERRGS
jgi:hypothetical protein